MKKIVGFPTIDPAFGSWLSGFVDGEGCFGIYFNDRGGRVFIFKVSLRADDIDVLKCIQTTLKVGHIRTSSRSGGENPKAHFVVQSLPEHSGVIVPMFRLYPLRSKKKRDFDIFADAVETRARNLHKHLSNNERASHEANADRLKLVKRYQEPSDALVQI